MTREKLGSWLKAVAAMSAAVGIYVFSDSQIDGVQAWIIAGWAFIDGAANTLKATKKNS